MTSDAGNGIPWDEIGLKLEPQLAHTFLKSLPKDEVVRRLKRLSEWLARTKVFFGVPVELTPVLADFLARPGDFEPLLSELERLMNETRNGQFCVGNVLQRDLEFKRFAIEYSKLPARSRPSEDAYELFKRLDRFPVHQEKELSLTEEDHVAVKRAAYEAVGFLGFLREFRSKASRPITVIGNDKAQLLGGGYGSQWVVKPLEEHLKGDFRVFYNPVTSHATMRLNIPSAFPRDFVKEICDHMPHIVIVDGAGPPRMENVIRFSRAIRGYANWFSVFNDLRAEGDTSRYVDDSLLPANHLAELKKWHQYVVVREQIEGWVTPGPTYRLTLWAPESSEFAMVGDVRAAWSAPDLSSDRPQVVLANPIIYRTNIDAPDRKIPAAGDEMSSFLTNSTPYYLDSADKRHRQAKLVDESATFATWGEVDDNPLGPVGGLNPAHTVFGFGPHGFERRVVGPTMERYVSEIQRHIKVEIARLLEKSRSYHA